MHWAMSANAQPQALPAGAWGRGTSSCEKVPRETRAWGSLENEDGGNLSFPEATGKDPGPDSPGQGTGLAKVERGGWGLGSSPNCGITMGTWGVVSAREL